MLRALGSWRTALPRQASNTVLRVFLAHGASAMAAQGARSSQERVRKMVMASPRARGYSETGRLGVQIGKTDILADIRLETAGFPGARGNLRVAQDQFLVAAVRMLNDIGDFA